MSEAILRALMQLFALIVDIDEVQDISEKEKEIIHSFLSRQLNSELTEKYMRIFEDYLNEYHQQALGKNSTKKRKRASLTAVRILSICEQINEELKTSQKVYVILQLVEYIAYGIEILETELEFLQTVASAFNLDEDEYQDILHFTISSLVEQPRKESILQINKEAKAEVKGVNHIRKKHFEGDLFILHISSINTFILRYRGRADLLLNGQFIQAGITYTFDHGSSIRGAKISPLYYTDVASVFSKTTDRTRLTFYAEHVEFRFKNSDNGIQDFNLNEESGRLIGIMGGSGVGKSTLLNVLNGNLEPAEGRILINGIDLYREKESLQGVIGFIPQDDLLLEDLSVRQNLLFNARLCLDQHSEKEIDRIVDQVLHDLDLFEIRDLKVGKPLNKIISGGQRKRVNIGLELIREPAVLFVDEPTSGLSSVDSEMVMNLLHEQAFKGRLVFINIHQPSSNLYKMFDKIIFMDKGGYQIYYGNPSEAVVYFKTKSRHANAGEDQCPKCGNVDADQVLQIIEAKIVNEYGKPSRNRKVSPAEWYRQFKEYRGKEKQKVPKKEELPANSFNIPGRLKQIRIFFTRDILSKITNQQYVLITLLEAPILAMIMGIFTKYFSGTPGHPADYLFRNNENLPAFLLMSVVVFLFLGLTISSEEIIKDRKIMQRESFLNLSRGSYLHSKILIMFSISAFQALAYVLAGNLIFEIKGMMFPYWVILFSTSCFANLLGLNISAGLNSVITIYILVPFLLIPQILFSGVLVKYEKLHKNLANEEFVPLIGNMMTSRWAYEALSVEQYKKNRYEKYYFDLNQEISNSGYLHNYLIPELEIRLEKAERELHKKRPSGKLDEQIELLNKEVLKLSEKIPAPALPELPRSAENWTDSTIVQLETYLAEGGHYFLGRVQKARNEKNGLKQVLNEKLGGVLAYTAFRDAYENKSLSDMLLARHQIYKIVENKGQLVRKYQPIYMKPDSELGRAHLYAPNKKLGNLEIDTLWFNMAMIWLMSLLLYISLYYDLLRKLLAFFGTRQFKKSNSKT